MGIYVEIFIHGSMDELWEKTQNPGVHQRWDLRFSEIEYLPRTAGEPQKFLYVTRIGAGMRIAGEGKSIGEHDDAIGKLVAPFGPERVSAAHVGRQDVDWIHHERLAAYIHDLAADLDDVSKL